jgi:GNAT superfamily N-acetyltransferase
VSECTIRQARDDEFDTIASLIVDAYCEYAAQMSPDAWSTYGSEIANVHGRKNDATLYVAEVEERVVGSVTMYSGWRGAQEGAAQLRLLAVPPEHRGSGVGRALMEACIEHAKRADKQRLVLTTTQEMAAVRELTERLGFVREPGLDHEPAPGVRYQGYALKLGDNEEGTAP